MFDIRIVSNTGATYNYFDLTAVEVQEYEAALPQGWELTAWFTPTEGEMEGAGEEAAEELYDGCNACHDSERYDDHIHEGA
jgi:hypothetical protein